MATTEPSYVSVLQALCRSITNNEVLRVKGKQDGYRCKATYSLLPKLQVSPLSMIRVNEIAIAVSEFCATHSVLPSLAPDFFFEVCVKVSRNNLYMLKLSLLNQKLSVKSAEASHTSLESTSTLRRDVVASALSVPLLSVDKKKEDGGRQETLFDLWLRSSEPYALEDYLRRLHPNLVALVAHVRLPSPSDAADVKDTLHCKPDKNSAYVPLTRDGASSMVEYTPNGHSFWLSADSFCEVNHEMETAIYETIVEFLRLSTRAPDENDNAGTGKEGSCSVVKLVDDRTPVSADGRGTAAAFTVKRTSDAPTKEPAASSLQKRRVFICGRDVNSVVRTFEEYYSSTTVVTTCPCVYADTKKNDITRCILCTKDKIAEPLRAFAFSCEIAHEKNENNEDQWSSTMLEDVSESESSQTAKSALDSHCFITAGRHGLHPNTTTALMEVGAAGQMSDLIYVSCNVDSLTRDVHVLKESWYIAHARTFDFFPGTDYVMTVLHLRPLTSSGTHQQIGKWRSGGGGDLLVLPVGVPGTGKSTCGRALDVFFQDAMHDGGKKHQNGKMPCGRTSLAPQKKRSKQEVGATCFVPRSFLTLPRHALAYRHVERDQIFHEARAASTSLRVAKRQTHESLMAALGIWQKEVKGETGNPFWQVSTPTTFPERRVLYLDSTNGSKEAQILYATLWRTSNQQASVDNNFLDLYEGKYATSVDASLPASCVTLFFDTPQSTEELLRRVQHRGSHPSFPSDTEEQQRKLSVITAVLREEEREESRDNGADNAVQGHNLSSAAWRIHASGKNDAAAETVQEVVLTVCAHLLFSRELAVVLRDDALRILRANAS